MESVDRLGIFERLKHSIQLLALSPQIQLKLLPDFVCKPDELALEFDHWSEVVLRNFSSSLSSEQMCCIESIRRSFSDLTRMGPEHWTEYAVRKSEEWKRLRTLSAAALESFGWAREVPPSHADEYVGSPAKGHIRVERSLSQDERILLEWLLAHSSSDVLPSDIPKYKSQIASLHVVAKCGCGCPTVDFTLHSGQKRGASDIVAEAGGKSPEGVSVGVILHAREGEISELEVYSTQGSDVSFSLPIPDSLEPYE
jgi:hypothetical protein